MERNRRGGYASWFMATETAGGAERERSVWSIPCAAGGEARKAGHAGLSRLSCLWGRGREERDELDWRAAGLVGLVYLVCLVGRIANSSGEPKKPERPDKQVFRSACTDRIFWCRCGGLARLPRAGSRGPWPPVWTLAGSREFPLASSIGDL